MKATRPKTVTIQLKDRDVALIAALQAKYGTLSTPTNICHAAMESGLLRLASCLGLPFDGAAMNGVWTEEEIRRALDGAPLAGVMRSAIVEKKKK